jgi:hypothetical protein
MADDFKCQKLDVMSPENTIYPCLYRIYMLPVQDFVLLIYGHREALLHRVFVKIQA